MNDNYDNIKDNIIELDEVDSHDIKINPDYYIHLSYVKAINSLSDIDPKSGFIKLRIFIGILEKLCLASGRIPKDDYNSKIKELEGSNDEQKTLNKLQLLSEYLFSNKTLTDPLKDID